MLMSINICLLLFPTLRSNSFAAGQYLQFADKSKERPSYKIKNDKNIFNIFQICVAEQ